MSMKYIRHFYNVPAKRGGKLIYTDIGGVRYQCTITSATRGGHIRVRMDTPVPGLRQHMKLHPTWNVEYLAANVVNSADTKCSAGMQS